MKRAAAAAFIALLLTCLLPLAAGGQDAAFTETWQVQTTPTHAQLFSVSAANDDTVFASGASGTILTTGNEGKNWYARVSGTGHDLNGIDCINSSYAVAVGNDGTVRYTDNSGVNWKNGSCNMSNNLTGVSMTGSSKGWASGLPYILHPFSSMWVTNNGRDFSDQGWWSWRNTRSVSAWDPSHAVTVGEGSIVCSTTNGSDWGTVHTIGSHNWNSVSVVPGTDRAVAVGNSGQIATCDGYGTGAGNWTLRTSGTGANLHGVSAVDGKTAWAVGDWGVILKTTDGGATWTHQPSPVSSSLFAVSGVDSTHAYAVGDHGVVLHAAPYPAITSCDPPTVMQGDSVVLNVTGVNTNFEQGVSRATFSPGSGINVISTTVVDRDDANVQISVDRTAQPLPNSVNIVTGTETPTPLADGLTILPRPLSPPRLDTIDPPQAPAAQYVTLSGDNFGFSQGSSLVMFANGIQGTDYSRWSNTKITVRVPPGAVSGPVFVTTPNGDSNPVNFTVIPPLAPVILDCDPQSVVQGQTLEVDILGSGTTFVNGVSRAVISGDGITVNLTRVADPTHATATVQVAAGASPSFRDVNVVTGAQVPTALANVFQVLPAPANPPVLSDLTPGSGPVSTMVTLSGANFGDAQGSSQVLFNGVPAGQYRSWANNRVVCAVPFGAVAGPVMVRTAWGDSGALHFGVTDFTFYFAEGTCRPNFDSYLTIQDPDDQDAQVRVTYMLGDGQVKVQELTVPAHSRYTVTVRDILGVGNDAAHDFSAKVECTNSQEIVVERPMYFDYTGGRNLNWTGGHDAVGALDPAPTFYFAEGTCRPNFQPYICVQNPGDADADVMITYMLGNSNTRQQQIKVAAHSRQTVSVADFLGVADDAGHDFSAKVDCINGQEIIAERPMYFDYRGGGILNWTGGYDVVGPSAPATEFYFAEGTCRPDFQPYICVQNPDQAYADVKITYFTATGGESQQVIHVPPRSRYTVAVRDVLGVGENELHDFSAKVESMDGVEIIAERPMYFNYNGAWNGGHDVVGAVAPSTSFYFAEGTCRPNFQPYLTIMNPELTHSDVRITYMLGDGTTKVQNLLVPAGSRYTVAVYNFLGVANDAAHDFSAKVECTSGRTIVVERPMYFNYNGVWTGGSDTVGFSAN